MVVSAADQSYAARQWAVKRQSALQRAEKLRAERKATEAAKLAAEEVDGHDAGQPVEGVTVMVPGNPPPPPPPPDMVNTPAQSSDRARAVRIAHKLTAARHSVSPRLPPVAAPAAVATPPPAVEEPPAHVPFQPSVALGGRHRKRWEMPNDGQLVLPMTGASPATSTCSANANSVTPHGRFASRTQHDLSPTSPHDDYGGDDETAGSPADGAYQDGAHSRSPHEDEGGEHFYEDEGGVGDEETYGEGEEAYEEGEEGEMGAEVGYDDDDSEAAYDDAGGDDAMAHAEEEYIAGDSPPAAEARLFDNVELPTPPAAALRAAALPAAAAKPVSNRRLTGGGGFGSALPSAVALSRVSAAPPTRMPPPGTAPTRRPGMVPPPAPLPEVAPLSSRQPQQRPRVEPPPRRGTAAHAAANPQPAAPSAHVASSARPAVSGPSSARSRTGVGVESDRGSGHAGRTAAPTVSPRRSEPPHPAPPPTAPQAAPPAALPPLPNRPPTAPALPDRPPTRAPPDVLLVEPAAGGTPPVGVEPVQGVPESKAPSPPAGSDDDPVYRQMVDKRQSRKVNRDAFMAAIDEWKEGNPKLAANAHAAADGRVPLGDAVEANSQTSPQAVGARKLRAILRKRPLFAYESERGEFDVVSVRGDHGVTVHNCQMQPDLKRMFMKHTSFVVGDAFDEHVTTPEVCARGVHPLLANVLAGGCSTLFMYGQTGSGKTHTMSGIEEYASELLLPPTEADADAAAEEDEEEGAPPAGHLSFFEICGSRCIELLGEQYGRELPLKQDADGRVQPVGVECVPVRTASELLELIAIAKSRRATEATGANAVSSRSHAVCQFKLSRPAAAAGRRPGGRQGNARRSMSGPPRHPILTLVDCAGTERKEDSMWHDAERRKEGAEINQSLHALKECMRHWVMQQEGGKVGGHIPFRESALTRVLADSFMRHDTLITVVGTVSPSASDTEHTVTTLKTVAAVAGTDGAVKEVKRDVKPIVRAPRLETIPPKLWDAERLRHWLETSISARGEPLANVLPMLPAGMNGKAIMRMTAVQIRQLWGAPQELADAIFHELRVATKAAEAAKNRAVKGTRQAEMRKKAGQLPAQ